MFTFTNSFFFFLVCSEVLFDSKFMVHLVLKEDILSLYTNSEISTCIINAFCLMINVDISKFTNGLRLPHFVFSVHHSVSHLVRAVKMG